MTATQADFDPIELLCLWWKAESQWNPVEGYPAECPSCRDYRTSRQYDGDNGASDTDATGRIIRHIAGVVQSIDEPHRSALYYVARNRAINVGAWVSVRLPEDESERALLVADAIELFSMRV